MNKKKKEGRKMNSESNVDMIGEVTIIGENNNTIQFRLKNTDVSIANAIRRTILADIPCVVIDTKNIQFEKNRTRLNNEFIKERLDMVPVCLSEDSRFNRNEEIISLQDFVTKFQLTAQKRNNSKQIEYLTTEDFQLIEKKDISNLDSLNNLNKFSPEKMIEIKNSLFPPDGHTGHYIDLVRLRGKIMDDTPAEEISFTANFKIGTARENASYNVVSTATYINTIDEITGEKKKEEFKIKCEEKNKYLRDKDENEFRKFIEFEVRNFELLNKQRYYFKNSFDFTVTSIGIYYPRTIVRKACVILIQKLEFILNQIATNTLIINQTGIKEEGAFEIKIDEDDYTIGPMIEYGLFREYYNQGLLTFCAHIQKHPHDSFSFVLIRIPLKEQDYTNDHFPLIKEWLSLTIQKLIDNFNRLL